MNTQYKNIFSIDVEAQGLYGEDFAVGVSVISLADGKEIDSLLEVAPLSDDFKDAADYTEAYKFLSENVLPVLPPPTCKNSKEVRCKFWNFYENFRRDFDPSTSLFVVDCGTPVEANFFRRCVCMDDFSRKWKCPYPLHELATLLLVRGKDPLATYERLENEKLVHNPLHDARQSGRLFYENFKN